MGRKKGQTGISIHAIHTGGHLQGSKHVDMERPWRRTSNSKHVLLTYNCWVHFFAALCIAISHCHLTMTPRSECYIKSMWKLRHKSLWVAHSRAQWWSWALALNSMILGTMFLKTTSHDLLTMLENQSCWAIHKDWTQFMGKITGLDISLCA